MIIIDINDIKKLLNQIGVNNFFKNLSETIKEDFSNWEKFHKSPRHATIVPNGIIELMPTCSETLYSFKYVNGHPQNTKQNLLTVVGVGMLTDVASGYPLLISEMTILTAIRTAATSALASFYLARKDSKVVAIIGCGAQSEFQAIAHIALLNIQEIVFFDISAEAMDKFAANMIKQKVKLTQVASAKEAVEKSDIIITSTAAPGKQKVIEWSWLKPGQHISGIGGDSPGKTELDPEIVKNSKTIIEFLPQTSHEGEIQNFAPNQAKMVHAELWEIIKGSKKGRENDNENTLFDSVGFAIEDYSTLRYVYSLCKKIPIGTKVNLIPETIADPRDLFGLIK